MSKYTARDITSIDHIKTGDLLTLRTPEGRLVAGRVLTCLATTTDSPIVIVWFDDGRSYPVSRNNEWTSLCHFNAAIRKTLNPQETQL